MLLALALIWGLVPAAYAAGSSGRTAVFREISAGSVTAEMELEENRVTQTPAQEPDEDEIVRVSIVLEKQSVLDRGFNTANIAANTGAMNYRAILEAEQQVMEVRISRVIGAQLDVAWNLTLAGNIISANVRYGDIEAIAAIPGVSQVVEETKYEPCSPEDTAQPNSGTATSMTGVGAAWASGYTGAGSRIAIVDTGLDIDHEAVDNGAFLYVMTDNAEAAGKTAEEYMSSLNLLDAAEIAAVLPQLNIAKGWWDYNGAPKPGKGVTAQELYRSEKIAFAYNYVDQDLDVTHDNDAQGAHGSHVAGIAAANRYLPEGEGYVPSMEKSYVVGVAPDAQLIVMKVFGKTGGACDSDYMAAIEDAILLNCDVVNLSLGSSLPGFTTSALYQDIMDSLSSSDTVVSISAGNNGNWGENTRNGYLYAEDVNLQTGGSPGTYTNSFTVASVDNDGITGCHFTVNGNAIGYSETVYNQLPMTSLVPGGQTEKVYDYVIVDGLGNPEDYAGLDVTGKVVVVQRGTIPFTEKHANAQAQGAVACVVYNNQPGVFGMNLATSTATIPAVSITLNQGLELIRNSRPMEGRSGCYEGEMTVSSEIGATIYNSEYYTMSAFSSWDVNGSLKLKPEITAPGGSINSIDGSMQETDKYTYMSGTSMAAPHIAGLTALVYQYFRETGLAERLEVSPRVLAQSLLMSTATPIVDGNSGNPYPVIQQGAGLASIADAMGATSYVLVEGQPDGKVKAELGDDRERTGVYTFSYTLHNMTDRAQRYTLDASVYTQASFYEEFPGYDSETLYSASFMDYTMTKLDAATTFTVNGSPIPAESDGLENCDFNGDGLVNELDGQALLDCAVGKLENLEHLDAADLDGNGIRKQLEVIDMLHGQFTKIKNQIMDEMKAEIEKTTWTIFDSMIWKKQTFGSIEIDDSYDIAVYNTDGIEMTGSLSATEQMALAYAFTLAIHRASGKNCPLVIDSPLGRVSDDNRENMARALQEVSRDKQIIMLFTPDEYSAAVRRMYDAAAEVRELSLSEDESYVEGIDG